MSRCHQTQHTCLKVSHLLAYPEDAHSMLALPPGMDWVSVNAAGPSGLDAKFFLMPRRGGRLASHAVRWHKRTQQSRSAKPAMFD